MTRDRRLDDDATQGGDGVSGDIHVDEAARLCSSVAEALRDKHAQDILEIDVRSFRRRGFLSSRDRPLGGQSSDAYGDRCRGIRSARLPVRVEGELSKRWRLVDCGGVVVHLFSREGRDYYRLERLFEDLPIRRIDAID
jgi:ribosome-associated protein